MTTTKINDASAFVSERQIKELEITNFGIVRIQKLLKSEMCQFQKWLRPKGKLSDERYAEHDCYLIALSVVDMDGKRIFADDQLDKIGQADGQAMDELAYEIKLFNGYLEAIEVDELLGKSAS